LPNSSTGFLDESVHGCRRITSRRFPGVAGWRQAMGYEVPSWRCILPLGNSQSILLGFPRMVWAIDCEVPGLDFRAVVCVDMIAPQAETNASAGGEVGTAAFTVGSRSLAHF